MERVFIGLNIAVLAVSEAESGASDACRRLVAERLGEAGHSIVQDNTIDDNVQRIRAKLLEHVADAGIDVVVVVASMKSESAGVALDPMITRPLSGFSDLLRMIAYQEVGSAAMLIDAEAAQCKQTFVFLIPGSPAAMALALDRLLIPQLDYRTAPRNLVMALPRVKHVDAGVVEAVAPSTDTNKQQAPWIVPRAPGDAPPSTATRAGASPAMRRSMQLGAAVPLAKASVSDIVEKTANSVSQKMSAISAEGAAPPPPPPPGRAKVNSTLPNPLEVKPPAKLVPLADLLPVQNGAAVVAAPAAVAAAPAAVAAAAAPVEVAAPPAVEAAPAAVAAAVAPVEPEPVAPASEPVRENSESTPTTPEHTFEVRRFTTPLPVAMDKVVVGPELSGPINVDQARKMISLADLERDDDELDEGEKINSGELIVPSGEINIAALADGDAAGRAEVKPAPAPRPTGTPAMGTRVTTPPPMIPRGATTPPINKPATPADNPTTPADKPATLLAASITQLAAASPTPARGTGVSVHVGKEPAPRAATSDDRRLVASAADLPRSVAEPREPRDRGGRLALILIGLLLLGAAAVIAVVLIKNREREARAAAVDLAPDPHHADPATQPPVDPPVASDPPPTDPPQDPAATEPGTGVATFQPMEPGTAEPTGPEIDMSSPDPNAPKQPKRPRVPRDTITEPATDPADTLATAPISKVEDGCDEVSCILDKYKQACCARFKPPEPPQDPKPVDEKPPSGLPEKLDKLMVQEGMAAIKPTVIACGERVPAKGTVRIAVKVSGSGKVVSATAVESPDPELGTCVAAAVKLARFPETDDGGSFNYPFAF